MYLQTPKGGKQKLPGLPQARTQMHTLSFSVITGSDRQAPSQSGRGPQRERFRAGALSEDQPHHGLWGSRGFPESQA